MNPVAVIVSANAAHAQELSALLRRVEPGCVVQVQAGLSAASVRESDAPPRLVILNAVCDTGSAASIDEASFVETRALFPRSPVLVTSRSVDRWSIARAQSLGALAYLPDSYTPRQRALVVELAWEGLTHFPIAALDEASPPGKEDSPAFANPDGTLGLTRRELDVLSHIAVGRSNPEIAARLAIKLGTVKLHVTSIRAKLGAESRIDAMLQAQRMPVIQQRLLERGEHGTAVLSWLLDRVAHRHHDAGDVLFRKGDLGRDLYYLIRGTIVLDEIGEEIGPGTIFGEVGAFAPTNVRTSTARCSSPVDLFCLDADQVKCLCYENPAFPIFLMGLVTQRLSAERGL